MNKNKPKKLPPRIPEGESIQDGPEMGLDELNKQFKKRMKEYERFVKFVVKDLNLKDNSNVLEIGPGPSWISILLVKSNPSFKLVGLEISNDMIKLAKKNISDENVENNISFILGNAKDMSIFEDKSFDAIISHDSLHHWEEPIQVFNEIARVLKDDGILCIRDGRRDIGLGAKIIFQLARFFISKKMSYFWKTSIMASYTPVELQEMINLTRLKNKIEIKTDIFDIIICSPS
ncbi:MAG: class I SAM-dependent methyltransferase [Candidatus Lokiarchaeota archaeon]|nr:class I SAM-dependent methyltransferase [Candidatus Lokiarchaeota archaeon]